MNLKNIFERIDFMLHKRGYSQEYMGAKLGIGQSGFSDLKHGKRKLDPEMIGKIAEVLEVSESFLLQNGPMVIEIHDNQHNTNVGYNQIEHQHMIPKDVVDRLLAAHERLIHIVEMHFGKPGSEA